MNSTSSAPGLLANHLSLIKPSPTISLNAMVLEMKQKGVDVIALGVGESDFDTPDNIKKSAIAAIESGKTRYTGVDGIRELKESIATKLKIENNLEYNTNQITVGAGAKQVIFNLLVATLNKGDEVIIPTPYWPSYIDMVLINGGKPVVIETDYNNDFAVSPDALDAVITKNTKWLFLNSPNNPSGACYSLQNMKEIADVLSKHDNVHVISDDIYEHILYDNRAFVNIANVSEEMKKKTFVINGVSKAYAMTGWRIGYGAGDAALIKAIAKIQSQSTSNPCSISQYAALEALSGPQDFILRNKAIFQKRRDLLISEIEKIQGLSMILPQGAFYAFVNCKELTGKTTDKGKRITSCSDVAEYFLEKALVAVVPGIAFGMEGFLRVSFAVSDEKLLEACKRISDAVAALK